MNVIKKFPSCFSEFKKSRALHFIDVFDLIIHIRGVATIFALGGAFVKPVFEPKFRKGSDC